MSTFKENIKTGIFFCISVALFIFLSIWFFNFHNKNIEYQNHGYVKDVGNVEIYHFLNPYHDELADDAVFVVNENKIKRKQNSNYTYSNYGNILTDDKINITVQKYIYDGFLGFYSFLAVPKEDDSKQEYLSKEFAGFLDDGRSVYLYRLNTSRASYILDTRGNADYNYMVIVKKDNKIKFDPKKMVNKTTLEWKTKDNNNVYLYRLDEKKESHELYRGYYKFYDIPGKESVTINRSIIASSKYGSSVRPSTNTTILY